MTKMPDPRPVRERLREYAAAHPGATAADIARVLNVSRQVVSRIANQEGLELAKYTTRYPEIDEHVGTLSGELGSRPAPLLQHAHGADRRAAAVLFVAADLVARGYEVFAPVRPDSSADLVSVSPGAAKLERWEVRTARGRSERPQGFRRATVLPNVPLEYDPHL